MVTARAAEVLNEGDIEVLGRMPFSSNSTFLVEVCLGGDSLRAVYKPGRGERPLWDFPAGLYKREVAAYEISEALGWGLVPLTVRRSCNAPFGEGSLQLLIDADLDEHYFSLVEQERLHEQLRRLCAFDLVINSTDRKAGHVLHGPDDRLWAVDNGLSFHTELKLRTVIWDFAGEAIPHAIVRDVSRLADEGAPVAVENLLGMSERDALVGRATDVVDRGVFPRDPTGRSYPWPLV